MMNIYLICNAGMSTGILRYQMVQLAEKRQLNLNIRAIALSELDSYEEQADFIFLGPQIRFVQEDVQQQMGPKIPVHVISQEDFGVLNVEKLLDEVEDFLNQLPVEEKEKKHMANKTIMLCCAAGMSTSMMVERMKTSAKSAGKDYEIFATAVSDVEAQVEEKMIDCILLGPQVRFMLPDVEKQTKNQIPVAVINSVDYGMMNGDKVLQQARALIKD